VAIVAVDKKYQCKTWLYNQYICCKKSTVQIAQENHICPNTVLYWLRKFGIERRTDFSGKNNPFFGKTHTEKTKEKLRRLRLGCKATDAVKKKMSEARKGKMLGNNNPATKADVKRKISVSQKKRYEKNPQLRVELSIRMKQRLKDSRNHPNYGNRGREAFGWKEPRLRKTVVSKRIRTSEKYIAWRKSCLERDKYTCQECGATNTYLEVDHCKYALCEIIQKYNITQENLDHKLNNCDILWDLSNGTTLCRPCHKKTPTYANKAKYYIKDGTKPSLKKCPNCGSHDLAYQEGCITCQGCGYSKCG